MKDEVELNKQLNLIVAIRNSITLICFTLLAIIFKTWWIVFFALLFWVSVTKDEKKE